MYSDRPTYSQPMQNFAPPRFFGYPPPPPQLFQYFAARLIPQAPPYIPLMNMRYKVITHYPQIQGVMPLPVCFLQHFQQQKVQPFPQLLNLNPKTYSYACPRPHGKIQPHSCHTHPKTPVDPNKTLTNQITAKKPTSDFSDATQYSHKPGEDFLFLNTKDLLLIRESRLFTTYRKDAQPIKKPISSSPSDAPKSSISAKTRKEEIKPFSVFFEGPEKKFGFQKEGETLQKLPGTCKREARPLFETTRSLMRSH